MKSVIALTLALSQISLFAMTHLEKVTLLLLAKGEESATTYDERLHNRLEGKMIPIKDQQRHKVGVVIFDARPTFWYGLRVATSARPQAALELQVRETRWVEEDGGYEATSAPYYQTAIRWEKPFVDSIISAATYEDKILLAWEDRETSKIYMSETTVAAVKAGQKINLDVNRTELNA